MDATPEQNKGEEEGRRILPEIIEKILLNLPVTSLLPLSRVSKSWRSVIFDSGFIKRHHVHVHENIVIVKRITIFSGYTAPAFSCPASSISFNKPVEDRTMIVGPLLSSSRLRASCDDLWCVQVGDSLFLWDPPMSISRKLPDVPVSCSLVHISCYGLGYDSVADDYKLVCILWPRASLYSLRRNTWREIECFPKLIDINADDRCVFLNGAFHWIVLQSTTFVVSFSLSSEKYTLLKTPEWSLRFGNHTVDVSVLKGKLCVGLNHLHGLEWWSMEDYGVEDSWKKMFDVDYPDSLQPIRWMIKSRPFYLCENGDVLIDFLVQIVDVYMKSLGVFVYKKEDDTVENVVCFGENSFNAFSYVQKLYFARILATCSNYTLIEE